MRPPQQLGRLVVSGATRGRGVVPCANRSGTLSKASFKKKIAGVMKGTPKKIKIAYRNHVEG